MAFSSVDDFLQPTSLPSRKYSSSSSLLPRPHSPGSVTSHYRPFSTLVSTPDSSSDRLNVSPSKIRRRPNQRNSGISRPLSALSTMGFLKSSKHKGKEREKEERPITPQRDSFLNRTLKPKKSLNSLMVLQEEGPPLSSTPPAVYTPSLSFTFAESSTAGYSNSSTPTSSSASSSSSTATFQGGSPPSTPIPNSHLDDFGLRESDCFEAKEHWVSRKHRLKLHPYGTEAPYMGSYDSVSLAVDRYTHMLLRRLNPNSSPSFYNYENAREPLPTSVLDLGCGQGHWLLDAASSWPEAQIVGLDLVDTILPEVRQKEHVRFVRGNFTRYPLPFPPNTFDLVRVANLTLAIPTDRWEYVLSEVTRVLQVGGRMELIDDTVHFPYGKETTASSSRVHSFGDLPNRRTHSSSDSKLPIFDLFEDDDDDYSASPDGDIHQDQNGEIREDSEQDQSVLNGISEDSEVETVNEEEEGGVSPGVTDESSDCPSSPDTAGDGLFLDGEDSRSSASSVLDPEDSEPKLTSLLHALSLPLASRSVRPLPPPRRPLPPIPASPDPADVTVTASKRADEEEDDEDDIVTPTKLDMIFPTPTLVLQAAESNNPISSEEAEPNLNLSQEDLSSPPSVQFAEPESEWSTHAKDGKVLESIFFDMLESKGIFTRTPKALATIIKDAFGSENVRKAATMHLKLAPQELEELIPHEKRPKFSVRSLSKGSDIGAQYEYDEEFGVSKRSSGERDASKKEKKTKKDRESVPFPTMKETLPRNRTSTMESINERSSSESTVLSAKAATRLGITYSALGKATKSAQPSSNSSPIASVHSNHSSSSVASTGHTSEEQRRDSSETQTSLAQSEEPVIVHQSPGLLLWPSTFLPMQPSEVEMHACKHMHTLLSWKRAMYEWILSNDDGTENEDISESDLEDAFFEYDSFRRTRLNWPSQTPDTNPNDYNYKKNIEVSFEGPKSPNFHKHSFSVDSHHSSTSEASIGPYNRHELTHVRTIRVYFALKTRGLKSRT